MFTARRQARYSRVLDDEKRPKSSSRLASRRTAQVAQRALGLALLLAFPSGAQYGPARPPNAGQQVDGAFGGMDSGDPVEKEKRLRALNAARHKSLVSDANKLLKLAQELDDEVHRTNPDSLTPAELGKVAEIEKLAHRVKDEMSTSVRGMGEFQLFPLRDR